MEGGKGCLHGLGFPVVLHPFHVTKDGDEPIRPVVGPMVGVVSVPSQGSIAAVTAAALHPFRRPFPRRN